MKYQGAAGLGRVNPFREPWKPQPLAPPQASKTGFRYLTDAECSRRSDAESDFPVISYN